MTHSAPRWWHVVVMLLLVAGLAFAIGRFSTFDAMRATGGETPNEADAGFARDMQVHHAQAVEMAMIEYRNTGDDELRMLSYDMALTQQSQRGEMYGWLVAWNLPQAGAPLMSWMADGHDSHATGETGDRDNPGDPGEAMGMASAADLQDLRALNGTAQDCTFLSLMIRHHLGALDMTDAVIARGSVARVVETAERMGASQAAEIDAMRAMQSRLACPSPLR